MPFAYQNMHKRNAVLSKSDVVWKLPRRIFKNKFFIKISAKLHVFFDDLEMFSVFYFLFHELHELDEKRYI